MKWGRIYFGIAAMVLLTPYVSCAQDEAGAAMLSIEATSSPKQESRVTAVYGLSADDYLPGVESARQHLRPKVRSRKSRPTLDLPDAFYFIGGPIFIFLFLRVLVIFLNGFEEKRREELRTVARDIWDA
jgi:hypothetical protein